MKSRQLISFAVFLLSCTTTYAQTNIFPSSGNVGIGTTDTGNGKLTIKGSSANGNLLRLENDLAGEEAVLRMRGMTSGGATLHADVSLYAQGGFLGFKVPSDNTIGAGHQMVITNSGRIGMGTTTPADRLDLGKGGNFRIGSSSYGSNGILRFFGTDDAEKLQLGAISNNGAFIYTPSAVDLNIYTGNLQRMTIRRDGNVGIGTNDPVEKLDVRGNVFLGDGSTDFNAMINGVYGVSWGWNLSSVASGFRIQSMKGGSAPFNIDADGNVGIGTTNTGIYKLAVNGDVKAKKITVTQSGWPDYVFDQGYPLMSLHQVEKFIQTNKHLPEIPSAKEVEEKGVSLGDNQVLLLKKIEELTLYLIEMKNENEVMKAQIKELQSVRKK